jgi:hypothetical protein
MAQPKPPTEGHDNGADGDAGAGQQDRFQSLTKALLGVKLSNVKDVEQRERQARKAAKSPPK